MQYFWNDWYFVATNPTLMPTFNLKSITFVVVVVLGIFLEFFYWVFSLFKFQMLSPFPVSPLETPYPVPIPLACMRVFPYPLTHSHLPPWHSPTLGNWAFIGTRASPSIDAWQGHPLLHMHLEPWVPPCVLLGGLVPGSSGGGGLVGWYCCSSYGLQTPSIPSVPSLTPLLGTPLSAQWLPIKSTSVFVRPWQGL